jgi:hypothetical protein
MASYLDKKQVLGLENQSVTGQGLNSKTQTILAAIITNSMGPENEIQTLMHSAHPQYRTLA